MIKISNRSQKQSTVPSFEEFLEYILASDLQGNLTNELYQILQQVKHLPIADESSTNLGTNL